MHGGSARQSHYLHVITELGLRENEQMRHVQGTRYGHEVLERVFLGDFERFGRERLHYFAHIENETFDVIFYAASIYDHGVRRHFDILALIVGAEFLARTLDCSSLFCFC